MELYILDSQLRREIVIDRFESLIWTERFSEVGEFELVVPATREFKELFKPNLILAVNTSYRCMIVKEIEDTKDDEGRSLLTVKGESLESLLKDRVASLYFVGLSHIELGPCTITLASPGIVTCDNAHKLITGDKIFMQTTGVLRAPFSPNTYYYVIKLTDTTFGLASTYNDAIDGYAINTTSSPAQSGIHSLFWNHNGIWRIKDTPGNIVRELIQTILFEGGLDSGIPFMTPGNIFPEDTIPEPEGIIEVDIPPGDLYSVVYDICKAYNLGFRLIRNFDTSELYFNVYAGSDRTTLQTTNPPVVFSPDLDNLSNTSSLTSIFDMKNVAWVYSQHGFEIVYGDAVVLETNGLIKKILYVDASNIELPAGELLTSILQRLGQEELAKHRSLFAFDGEIPQFGSYRHHTDYHIGDLVEMRNEDGFTNNMRVTEHITIQDREGERSYPTLSTELIITPGSWFSLGAFEVWDDYDAEVWDDL